MFLKKEFRTMPVTITGKDKKEYGILLVYDDRDTDTIFIGTNKEYIKDIIEKNEIEFIPNKLRFITYYEFLYLLTLPIAQNKVTSVCRYPITGKWSNQEGHIMIGTTTPNRNVYVNLVLNDAKFVSEDIFDIHATDDARLKAIEFTSTNAIFEYPNWPDIDNGRPIDGIALNTIWLTETGADFDGDTVSNYGILSKEANKEITDFINSPGRIIDLDFTFVADVNKGSVGALLEYLTK
jgi:hypothetical protein